MLKKPAGCVLAALKGSTLSSSDVGNTRGDFPFAKIHWKGERPTRSAVCTSSGIHLLRPCLRKGASLGKEAVLAASGWAGVVAARVGRMRRLNCLSILQQLLGRVRRAE